MSKPKTGTMSFRVAARINVWPGWLFSNAVLQTVSTDDDRGSLPPVKIVVFCHWHTLRGRSTRLCSLRRSVHKLCLLVRLGGQVATPRPRFVSPALRSGASRRTAPLDTSCAAAIVTPRLETIHHNSRWLCPVVVHCSVPTTQNSQSHRSSSRTCDPCRCRIQPTGQMYMWLTITHSRT